jgi:hypothetical protein
VENETTPDEKEKIRFIIQKLIEGDKEWFKQQNINVGNKADFWVLNYGPDRGKVGPDGVYRDNSNSRNDYNRLVRGMVVQRVPPDWKGDNLSLIKSFPFTRFFNSKEKGAVPIDFANSEMLEKLDGCLLGVFFPDRNPRNPHWHTRSMVSSEPKDYNLKVTSFQDKEFYLLREIEPYVKSLHFDVQDTHFSYVFEFLHEASYIVTKYKPEQYGLYLLMGRNLPTHKELSEGQLDAVAARIGARRPRRWDSVASQEEIQKMMNQVAASTQDFEGFVFRDRATGGRIKMKNLDYIQKHRLLDDTSMRNLLPLILKGEEAEILAYLPHVAKKIGEINTAYNNYIENAVSKVREWQAKGLSQKDLSIQLAGQPIRGRREFLLAKAAGKELLPPKAPGEPDSFLRGLIIKNSQVKDDNEIRDNVDAAMREVALGKGKNAGSPKKLIEILGLKDDEEETPQQNIGEI